jgi:hypothetical protein
MYMHIGSPEGVNLLEFKAKEQEDQPETQQQEGTEGGELVQEELLECLDHKPASFLKRQAPECSKLCFYKYQLEFFMFDVLGCRSWMETLDAYIFLVQNIYLEPYVGLGSNICLAMLSSVEVG